MLQLSVCSRPKHGQQSAATDASVIKTQDDKIAENAAKTAS